MKFNLFERIGYSSLRRVLCGYAAVFARGLFALESRQDRFESETKEVAKQLEQACLRLDSRLKALESKVS